VAVQTIKSIARRAWGQTAQNRHTWYEPLEAQTDIDKAVHWLLSHPGIFLNTVGDIHVLPRVLNAASRFQAGPSEQVMKAELAEAKIEPLFV
jgi:hypothetical protein